MSTSTARPAYEAETYKRVWLLGLSASVAMLIGAFIPWFVDVEANVFGTTGDLKIGIDFGAGQVAMFAAVAAVGGWLSCRRLVAGLFSVIALYAVSLTYTPMLVAIEGQWAVGWGYMLFIAGGLVSLSASVIVGGSVRMEDGRDRIRAFLDHHLNPSHLVMSITTTTTDIIC